MSRDRGGVRGSAPLVSLRFGPAAAAGAIAVIVGEDSGSWFFGRAAPMR